MDPNNHLMYQYRKKMTIDIKDSNHSNFDLSYAYTEVWIYTEDTPLLYFVVNLIIGFNLYLPIGYANSIQIFYCNSETIADFGPRFCKPVIL